MVKTVPMAECDKDLAKSNGTALCVGTLVAHEGVARSRQQRVGLGASAQRTRGGHSLQCAAVAAAVRERQVLHTAASCQRKHEQLCLGTYTDKMQCQ
jgi:hypothetical protein